MNTYGSVVFRGVYKGYGVYISPWTFFLSHRYLCNFITITSYNLLTIYFYYYFLQMCSYFIISIRSLIEIFFPKTNRILT